MFLVTHHPCQFIRVLEIVIIIAHSLISVRSVSQLPVAHAHILARSTRAVNMVILNASK